MKCAALQLNTRNGFTRLKDPSQMAFNSIREVWSNFPNGKTNVRGGGNPADFPFRHCPRNQKTQSPPPVTRNARSCEVEAGPRDPCRDSAWGYAFPNADGASGRWARRHQQEVPPTATRQA